MRDRAPRSVWEWLNQFQPTMAPTMACVVDTGSPTTVMPYTVSPAASATVKAPPNAVTLPKAPRPAVVPLPPTTAPTSTNTAHSTTAVGNRTIRLPTAVPNTLAASLAPSDQPSNRPLDRKTKNATSIGPTAPALERPLHGIDGQRVARV